MTSAPPAATADTIDSRVLDLLSDEIIVECVTKSLELERNIQSWYAATASGAYRSQTEQNEAASHTRIAVHQARDEQAHLRQRLIDRFRRRVEEIGREEREASA